MQVTFTWEKPATVEEVDEFQTKNSVALPPALRQYFLRSNGTSSGEAGFTAADGMELLVLKLTPLKFADTNAVWSPVLKEDGLLVIGLQGGGDYFFATLDDGQIYYWNHDEDEGPRGPADLMWLAAGIDEFIAALHEFTSDD